MKEEKAVPESARLLAWQHLWDDVLSKARPIDKSGSSSSRVTAGSESKSHDEQSAKTEK